MQIKIIKRHKTWVRITYTALALFIGYCVYEFLDRRAKIIETETYQQNIDLKNEVTDLKDDINDKDIKINDLADKEIVLNNIIIDQNGQIGKLRNNINGLNDTIKTKDADIAKLNNTVKTKDIDFATLNSAVRAKEADVTRLNNTVKNKDAEITRLNNKNSEKDGQIRKLNSEVTRLNNTIQTKNNEILKLQRQQTPQLYKARYNAYLHKKLAANTYEQGTSYYRPGDLIHIYHQTNGFGLSEYGWIKMNLLEKY